MAIASFCQSLQAERRRREARPATRNPNESAIHPSQQRRVYPHPRLEPFKFLFNRLDIAVCRSVNFHPMYSVAGIRRRSISNAVVPTRRIRQVRTQCRIDINTAGDSTVVPHPNARAIRSAQSPKPMTNVVAQRGTISYCSPKPLTHLEFNPPATASATSAFARALNSPRPPQRASSSFSASGSREEISSVLPVSRSK